MGAKFGIGLAFKGCPLPIGLLLPIEKHEVISLSIAHEAHRSKKHHVPTKRSLAPISLAPTLV